MSDSTKKTVKTSNRLQDYLGEFERPQPTEFTSLEDDYEYDEDNNVLILVGKRDVQKQIDSVDVSTISKVLDSCLPSTDPDEQREFLFEELTDKLDVLRRASDEVNKLRDVGAEYAQLSFADCVDVITKQYNKKVEELNEQIKKGGESDEKNLQDEKKGEQA